MPKQVKSWTRKWFDVFDQCDPGFIWELREGVDWRGVKLQAIQRAATRYADCKGWFVTTRTIGQGVPRVMFETHSTIAKRGRPVKSSGSES